LITGDYHGGSARTVASLLAGLAVPFVMAAFPTVVLAQNVTVRVTILEVKALTNMDGLDEADWFASVVIDGTEFDNEETPEVEDLEGNDHIFVNWEFSKTVDLSAGSVAVNIEIRDEDDFLKLADDLADINPQSGKATLDMSVDLAPCAAAGDVNGPCRLSLHSFSNNDDADGRAEIRFKIEVLNAPGLLVRCTHVPIWPQPGEIVTLQVDALDGNLNLRTADTLAIVREDVPDDTQSSQASHSLTFTPAGDSFAYGCSASAAGNDVFSDWRRVLIGDPPSGRSIPVLLNEGNATGVDIVLVPDDDDYSGASDPTFLDHAADIVYDLLGGLYSEAVFLERQHQINVFLAMDNGDAEPFDSAIPSCPHVPPANIASDYLFAEAFGIIHADVFRNCARGDGVFSATPPKLLTDAQSKRVFVHELGHRPFGLADEYCNQRPGAKNDVCDGGYMAQTAFFPNVFGDAATCAMDAASAGFGTVVCDEWIDDRGGGPWSTYDPVVNDLMFDNGVARFLDRRRILGFLDNCPMGGC
jgi:hypothetical protein